MIEEGRTPDVSSAALALDKVRVPVYRIVRIVRRTKGIYPVLGPKPGDHY